MTTQWKSVSTHDMKGLKQAERLLANGWTLYRTGLFMVYFKKERR